MLSQANPQRMVIQKNSRASDGRANFSVFHVFSVLFRGSWTKPGKSLANWRLSKTIAAAPEHKPWFLHGVPSTVERRLLQASVRTVKAKDLSSTLEPHGVNYGSCQIFFANMILCPVLFTLMAFQNSSSIDSARPRDGWDISRASFTCRVAGKGFRKRVTNRNCLQPRSDGLQPTN